MWAADANSKAKLHFTMRTPKEKLHVTALPLALWVFSQTRLAICWPAQPAIPILGDLTN